MNKPIKPPKPSKNSSLPPKTYRVSKEVVLNYDQNKLILIDEDFEPENEDFWIEHEHITSLDFNLVNKISRMLPDNIDNFNIDFDIYDGYKNGLIVDFYDIKDQEQYSKEVLNFENRFKKYEEDLAQWEKDMVTYEECKRQEKINKLQKELDKLS